MLHLFVDTNFFIHCLVPEEFPWNEVAKEEITIYIPTAVIRELDRHKSDGNTRIASRARRSLPIFEEILRSQIFTVSHKRKWPVRIKIPERLGVIEPFCQSLDLTKPDDCLTNEVLYWRQANPEKKVKVLTDDINLCIVLQHFGIEFLRIQDHWRLPPETDGTTKKIKELEKQILELKKTHPEIAIEFSSRFEIRGDFLEITIPLIKPLTEKEIDLVASEIFSIAPMKTDFSPFKLKEPEASLLRMSTMPPPPGKIAQYRKEYEEWKNSITVLLRQFHRWERFECFKEEPHLSITVSNAGGAPAEDVIVNFNLSGSSGLTLDDGIDVREGREIEIPMPPTPPTGNPLLDLAAPLMNPNMRRFYERASLVTTKLSQPDDFEFYKRLSKTSTRILSYRCRQFRHHQEPGVFPCYFFLSADVTNIENAELRCQVSANNISRPVEKILRVKVIRREEALEERVRILTNMFYSHGSAL